MTDAPALEALREAIAYALMLAKVNGSPVHEHLGDLMRAVTPDTISALSSNGFTIATVAEAEAGRAVLALPEEAMLYWYDDQGDVPKTWIVRVPSIQRNRKAYHGPTPQAAIAAALQDEATR